MYNELECYNGSVVRQCFFLKNKFTQDSVLNF